MRKLFAVVLLSAAAVSADEIASRVAERGLNGEGQVIAVLDTGVDIASCYFAEADGSLPPINLSRTSYAVDPSRRKVIAYDFLYSCAEFPGAPSCDDPAKPGAFDNHGHGTHAAGTALGDAGRPGVRDYADGIAPGAKLVVQDGGLSALDFCTARPGFGCPPALTPVLEQAYRQGARIHSNSWGDRSSQTGSYSNATRDVDAFVWSHPDMLVVFNTGNYFPSDATREEPPASSLSTPGAAKNTLQVGGTRPRQAADDSMLAGWSLIGPTRDGRIKPDLVAPAWTTAADAEVVAQSSCGATPQGGTSWSSPTIAGAAALVRQYYADGYYPGGTPGAASRMTPSAALLKATLIAAARPVEWWEGAYGTARRAAPVPSAEQGFGFPVLDDALFFAGERKRLRVADVPADRGLSAAASASTTLNVRAGTPLKVVLVWTDPPGSPLRGSAPQLVNDLDVRLIGPDGAVHYPNGRREPDRLNNVEVITVSQPSAGTWTVAISAERLGLGPRQGYASVITGDFADAPARVRAVRR